MKIKAVAFALIMSVTMVFAMQNGQNKKMKGMFQSVPVAKADIMQNGADKMYCPNCGMYLPKFYKTSHAARLEDGTVRQYCSIYCLVEEMEITTLRDRNDEVTDIMVVDVPSLKYIDAKKAYYVVGSKKKGTMTTTSKYAFKNQADANKFAAKNGGVVTDFNGAYNTALSDFAKDTGLVLAMRSTKMYEKGKMLYNNKCDKEAINKIDAHTMGAMKAIIKDQNLCGKNLKDGQLQAIMLYNWDVRLKNFEKLYGKNKKVYKSAEKFKNKMQEKMKNKGMK